MTIDNLIKELKVFQDKGLGELSVEFDYGACEVESVKLEKSYNEHYYIHLDTIGKDEDDIEIENYLLEEYKNNKKN
jgi:hypothetical protein